MADEKIEQVATQCKAVAHLANVLANIYADYEGLFAAGGGEHIVDIVGQRTAAFMETLGEMLNATDAVDEDEDQWLDPIFAAAQRLWPAPSDDAVARIVDGQHEPTPRV